ncbi:MAG: type II secretion system protein, partial [Candidatus Riflebacteria bacterium]|nr:type II secretion system protein [Candidatus Riflebacteria bacterium]
MPRTVNRRAFTLLELIIVVLISGSMSIVLALFLQRGVSVYSRVEDEAQLVGRVRFGLDRLRKCARHSISGFCNWVGTAPAAFDYSETLFFLTDFDQNGHREAHFIWFDRGVTNSVIHAWKEGQDPSWTSAGLSTLTMPPDMGGGSF